ncbi:MAG: type II toxin-antitoxin system RelE/ParE family toxin [Thermodesulfovibrionales bacterium]
MACKVEFLPEAEKDFRSLDTSVKKEAAKKIDALSENPFLGKHLGNRFGIDLTGLYKLYFAKKKYRIVYRLIAEEIEVVEIVGIGKREKEEIYRLVGKRIKQRQ